MREPPSRAARLTGVAMFAFGVLLFVRAFHGPFDPSPTPDPRETCSMLSEARRLREQDPSLPRDLANAEEMLRKYNQVIPVYLPTPCLEHK